MKEMKVYSENKKAIFNYEILEKYEAGLILIGQEVKSIKLGHISLAGSYVVLKDEEVYLIGAHIPAYQPKNASPDYNPERSRKLLLRKEEIKKLIGQSRQKGLTIIPLRVYTNNGKIKLEFGTARGRKKFDKRDKIKKGEANREISRVLKTRG